MPDVPPDSIPDPVDPLVDSLPDVPVEPPADTGPDSPPCTVAPPCPEGPEDGTLGRPCEGPGACDDVPGAVCRGQIEEFYNGEEYLFDQNGSCVLYTAGDHACDPEDHSGCPLGSRCLPTGYTTGSEWFMCLDACTPADTSAEPFDWACGCHIGYRCDWNYRVCLSGCSNDRECCETWSDVNHNFIREDGEVLLWPECTSYCDGDDPEEMLDCRASHACVNPGAPGARFGDPCDHDSHCPVDGQCWGWIDPESGEEYPPGGYCTRMGCQFAGRGCEDGGGACLAMGWSLEEPSGFCVRGCHSAA